ncbi:hypothetical protein AC230_21370 [Streptomyces caatingaensis]|uniref:Uncharacterized protein n=1 Tax=Streptomyces caatingaensis TaxID=1678637 RepID=A0A0K9XCY2_9ACTN|nr:hypothetical protein AC230_21370 [Streptomyces caatingaensis]
MTSQCVRYLQSKNYAPTNERIEDCSIGGHFNGMADKGIAHQACKFGLNATGVRFEDAITACNYAQESQ